MLLHIFYGATLFSQVRRAVTIFHTIFLSEGSRAPAFQKEVCLKATPGTMTTRSHLHDNWICFNETHLLRAEGSFRSGRWGEALTAWMAFSRVTWVCIVLLDSGEPSW